jgi:hypothetical protein
VRSLILSAVVLLVTGGLTSCSSQTDQYCDTLREDQPALKRLAAGSGANQLQRTLDVFQDLRADAPEDLADEWDTVVFAWQTLAAGFRRAGVDPGDYRPGQPPAGVSKAEARDIADAAEELRSPRVLEAGRSIEQHARDVCHVDLGF